MSETMTTTTDCVMGERNERKPAENFVATIEYDVEHEGGQDAIEGTLEECLVWIKALRSKDHKHLIAAAMIEDPEGNEIWVWSDRLEQIGADGFDKNSKYAIPEIPMLKFLGVEEARFLLRRVNDECEAAINNINTHARNVYQDPDVYRHNQRAAKILRKQASIVRRCLFYDGSFAGFLEALELTSAEHRLIETRKEAFLILCRAFLDGIRVEPTRERLTTWWKQDVEAQDAAAHQD